MIFCRFLVTALFLTAVAAAPVASPTLAAAKADRAGSSKSGRAAARSESRIAKAKKRPDPGENAPHALRANPPPATVSRPQAVAPPAEGERIVFLGNGLAERDVYFGQMETELHLRYPARRLIVRNMGRPGDTPGFRPHAARESPWAFPGAEKFHPELAEHHGQGFFPTPDQWLTHLKAGTIVAFFGLNESFDGPERVGNFEAELEAFVRHTLGQAYNGTAAPRLVLVSPIAFEDLSATRDLPDGREENANLALYTAAIERVARRHGLTFVDFFTPTKARYARGGPSLTINGFAPTEAGFRELGAILAAALYGPQENRAKADPEMVNAAVKEKDWYWRNDYQLVNGIHAYGRRYSTYGPQNYPDEVKKTRELTALRDQLIHDLASGRKKSLAVDDSGTRPLPPVPTSYRPTMKGNGDLEYLGGEEAIEMIKMAEGYAINLFASEAEFPELRNPVQMAFDNRGRLWVAVIPTYPHYRPGDPMPNDKLLILEDTDHDGRADRQTVFADGLHLPIGFELAPEGVYVSQEPNLCLLVDDDKDDRADRLEILVHGFDTHDTHHAISAFCADASGAIYMGEGVFLHSQIETPYGPRRAVDAGVWRFDPKSRRLEHYSQAGYANPWGIAFNHWQQAFIADASPGLNWWGVPVSAKLPHGVMNTRVEPFLPKRLRPACSAEFISSRHFPDEHQGYFLHCNVSGFLGVSLGKPQEEGSGFTGTLEGDLLSSRYANFRPIELEFGPDGALYVVDWQKALIGHAQHNARDPNRDRTHGRIYRVTYPDRPLVRTAQIAGASIPELLENLRLPEYRTRYRTRRELRGRPAGEVIPAVKRWAAALDRNDPAYEHHLCEALWATWAQNQPDADLLRQCLRAQKHEARAAAAAVLRFNPEKIPDATGLLLEAARDRHGQVRLEAIVAASWLDNADGARIALEALKRPLDRWMGPVTDQILKETLDDDIAALQAAGELNLADNPIATSYLDGTFKIPPAPPRPEEKRYGPGRAVTFEEARMYDLGRGIFVRDGSCATCHQADGKGLATVYPPLTDSDWLEDEERLIKIVLKGLWGPIDVNGVTFDAANGTPPMPGFGGLLNDEEVAAVISYVRQSWGNQGGFLLPEKVAKVREQTADRVNFYLMEELLAEHPLAK